MKPTALLLLAGIAICMIFVVFFPESEQAPAPISTTPPHDHAAHAAKTSTPPATAEDVGELTVTDQVVGSGKEAVPGKKVTVHYTGWLYKSTAADKKGLEFDSSRGSQAFQFTLGQGQVIRGWDEGVKGMKVGGKRVLVIPSSMGYGQQGSGQIPPNAPLMFEVEVLGVD